MTDLLRHSPGIWRSIYVFGETTIEQAKIVKIIEEELLKQKLEYSYCHYGEVNDPVIPALNEKAHVTFRINFPGTTSYDKFRAFMEKQPWTWEDHGYDEALWVKKAYVIGTKIANEIKGAIKHPDIPFNEQFLMLMFHGCFNDLHYGKKREVELYYALLSDMLSHVYRVKTK